MNDSLSIIVPVRDAEATVAAQVHELLDILPDLTHRFEVILVDDGSTDQTVDIVAQLRREFPQLRLFCHQRPLGREAAIKTGLRLATAQTVLVQEDEAAVSPTSLRRLWSLRHDCDLVMARAQKQPGVFDAELLDRLTTWGQTLRNQARRTAAGGIQMIRRDGAQAMNTGKLPAARAAARLHDR